MKELSIVKQMVADGQISQEVAEKYFPELKEPDDEKIRKDIVTYLQQSANSATLRVNAQKFNKWIAWLEKQKSEEINVKALLTADKLAAAEMTGRLKKRKDIVENPQKYGLEKQGEPSIKWNKNTEGNKPQVNHSVLMKTTHGIAEGEWQGEYWHQYRWAGIVRDSDVLSWVELSDLEKQGEQKQDVNMQINPSEYINDMGGNGCYLKNTAQKSTDTCDSSTINGKEFPASEKQDFGYFGKTADKDEPKFKVGDWVVWDNKISCHIDNIYQGKNSLMYAITDTNNMTRDYSVKGFDNNAYLWTIKDAKDGDVLADKDNNIGIYKEIEGIYWDSYIYLGCDGKLRGFSIGGKHEQPDTHPATKEQRDTLERAMTNAGYKWNKKELILEKI